MTAARAHIPLNERLVSLDVFRGATIAAMLLVNDPGSWSHIYPPLEHATWNGWTFTDTIFPFFLFIVGITTHLSVQSRLERGDDPRSLVRPILRRGGTILLLGLILNAFPFYAWWKIPSIADPTLLQRVVYRFAKMRFPGVLPRIGVAYMAAGLIAIRATRRQIAAVAGSILVGYWLVMTLVPVPGTGTIGAFLIDQPGHDLSAWLDRLVFGPHLWLQTVTWDPEGILSTFPAIATVLLGILAGEWIRRRELSLEARLNGLFAWGALGMGVGLAWNWFFPINKNLWTSSYTVFMAGLGAVTLATTMWIVDLKGNKRWTPPFVAFGINPILAFVGSGLMARFLYSLIKVPYGGKSVPLVIAIYHTVYASWLPDRLASLGFAVTFVLLWLAILWPLYKKGIAIRV